MGTSVSQMSPRTRGWNIVQTIYKTQTIPIERAVKEIWRAAETENNNLAGQLAAPLVEQIGLIASGGGSPVEVAAKIDSFIAESGHSNFGCELARLAAIKAAQVPSERRNSEFRERLFTEASNYLISRDISGFVGDNFRNKNISDLVEFKEQAKASTINAARRTIESSSVTTWSDYVKSVVEILRGKSEQ